jgi:3'-phosphoadenosine 5'-phosphosulfate (PAPS) 3'-phosphatase
VTIDGIFRMGERSEGGRARTHTPKTAFSPGVVCLKAAGGRVETLAGTPLTYGKTGFKNDGFLAWGCRP